MIIFISQTINFYTKICNLFLCIIRITNVWKPIFIRLQHKFYKIYILNIRTDKMRQSKYPLTDKLIGCPTHTTKYYIVIKLMNCGFTHLHEWILKFFIERRWWKHTYNDSIYIKFKKRQIKQCKTINTNKQWWIENLG